MLRFQALGNWPQPAIATAWTPSTRRTDPTVESAINSAWSIAAARLGTRLFDGPMCRLESWHATPHQLHLQLSPTSYKPFLGTNMANPHFASQFGPEVMANPLGVSSILLTADNWLLLGRRNQSVAYYPGRIHTFAGCLEPADNDNADSTACNAAPNVFSAARRELAEELGLTPADTADMHCVGLAQDQLLLQSELLFFVRLPLPRARVERQLDAEEHHSMFAVSAIAAQVEHIVAARGALPNQPVLTPIAVAALLLWGRRMLGQEWFSRVAAPVIV
jgi:8-oxo-dGTP pyrophosphatase MutT (NUDIX family)